MRLREAQSGPVPCSGARRQNKVLDVVGAAILGGVAAENDTHDLPGKPTRPMQKRILSLNWQKRKTPWLSRSESMRLLAASNCVTLFLSVSNHTTGFPITRSRKTDYNLSYSSGSTSGDFANTDSNFSRLPRLALFPK